MIHPIEDIERFAEKQSMAKEERVPWDWIPNALKSWMQLVDVDKEADVEPNDFRRFFSRLAENASHEAIQWSLQHRHKKTSTSVSQESPRLDL